MYGKEIVSKNNALRDSAEQNNKSAVNRAKEQYRSQMQALFGQSKSFGDNDLRGNHVECKNAAVKYFYQQQKLGGKTFSETFVPCLEKA